VFELKNVFQKANVIGCGLLECSRINTFDSEDESSKSKKNNISFEDYLEDYESDSYVYLCTKDGEANYTKFLLNDLKKYNVIDYMKEFSRMKLGHDCKYPDAFWKENWFFLNLEPNKCILDKRNSKNQKTIVKYMDLKPDDQWAFLNNTTYYAKRHPKLVKKPENKFLFLENIDEHPFFYFFDMKGHCDHDDIKKDLNSFGQLL
jgi:hypothetical protein